MIIVYMALLMHLFTDSWIVNTEKPIASLEKLTGHELDNFWSEIVMQELCIYDCVNLLSHSALYHWHVDLQQIAGCNNKFV